MSRKDYCDKHKVNLMEWDCSMCGGNGWREEEDDMTGEWYQAKCRPCNGTGNEYRCEECEDVL